VHAGDEHERDGPLGYQRPAVDTGADLAGATRAAAEAATRGLAETVPLQARKGRASYLGERSKDHQDPGATSTYYLFKSAAESLAG